MKQEQNIHIGASHFIFSVNIYHEIYVQFVEMYIENSQTTKFLHPIICA